MNDTKIEGRRSTGGGDVTGFVCVVTTREDDKDTAVPFNDVDCDMLIFTEDVKSEILKSFATIEVLQDPIGDSLPVPPVFSTGPVRLLAKLLLHSKNLKILCIVNLLTTDLNRYEVADN